MPGEAWEQTRQWFHSRAPLDFPVKAKGGKGWWVTSRGDPVPTLLLPTSARVPSPPYQHFPVLAVPVEAEEVA